VAGDEMRDEMLDVVCLPTPVGHEGFVLRPQVPDPVGLGSRIAAIVIATAFCSSLRSTVSMPSLELSRNPPGTVPMSGRSLSQARLRSCLSSGARSWSLAKAVVITG
jgi:hypothetical protein